MFLSKNIKYLRHQRGMTQEALSQKLGVKRTMISAYEDGRSEPKLSGLKLIAETFDISLDELLKKDIAKAGQKYSQNQPVKILAITVDKEEVENICLIGQKASAGYLNGFSDPDYMEQLPQFRLPHLSGAATYRAFEITGDSMLPLVAGTIIIGAYVEQPREVKNGKTYILMTRNEGLVYKRVFNYLEEKGKLYLTSDNDIYKPYEISGYEVLELWEARAYISTDFPQPKDKDGPVSLEEIARMIQDLRADLTKVK